MDDSIRVIIISGVVSVVGGIITFLVTKWVEYRQKKVGTADETKGALALAKYSEETIIRKEMQVKIAKLELMIDRQERAFITLRDSVNDLLRETLITMQMAIHELKSNHPDAALRRLEEGVVRLTQFKAPELPPVEVPKE